MNGEKQTTSRFVPRGIISIVLWAAAGGLGGDLGLALTHHPSDSVSRYVECFFVMSGISAVLDMAELWRTQQKFKQP